MTKTETLRRALVRFGYAPEDSKSARDCYSMMRVCKDGVTRKHYVWILTGTLRGGLDSRFGESRALPGLVARLMSLP